MNPRSRAVVAAALVAVACERPHEEASTGPVASQAALGGDVVAKVGSVAIGSELVGRVAAEQRIPAREAVRKLIDDAVASEAARARGIDRDGPARWLLVAARARILSDRYRADAIAEGPPTDAEVADVAKKHWREVDRPPSVRVVHALVKRPSDASKTDEARAYARVLAQKLAGATDADDFEKRAKESPPSGLEVIAESLPPFTEEGDIVEGAGRMDETFARAAFAIDAPGRQSGVVETPFGFHVIRLVERLPERRMPLESRRVAFADEIFVLRARRRVEEALAAERQRLSPAILSSADATMLEAHREKRP